MASSSEVSRKSISVELPAASPLWRRFLLPSFSDCLFIAIFVWLFSSGSGGWASLLDDGDTGWHIRTGEWILRNGMVPRQDLFSFSKAGEAWFAWEWLTDVLYAALHGAAGLKGVILLSALVIAGFGTILFRHMIARGANPFAALAASLLVFGASSIHYLARPHVFTLLGMTVSLLLIDADRRKPAARIWLLVPMTLVWVNLHGGFLGLIGCLGLLVAGSLVEAALAVRVDGVKWNLRPSLRYAVLFALCTAVTFVNPYGWHLHYHVFQFLRSDWIKNTIQEFQSPVFRSESSMQFELMLFLGLMTVAWLLARRQIVPALWILFWAHSALASVRHVPLFMIVAAPWVAALLTELWSRHVETAGRKSLRSIFANIARDMRPGCSRSSVWIAAAAAFFALVPETVGRWPKDFPAAKFPVAMAARHQEILTSRRTLTEDQWADYLIYRNYPHQKVFVDGRSDFFGEKIGEEYLHMMQGRWDWAALMEKYRFEVVLSPLNWPLTTLLKQDSNWRVVDDNGRALLFEKVRANESSVPVPSGQRFPASEKKAQHKSNENARPGRS